VGAHAGQGADAPHRRQRRGPPHVHGQGARHCGMRRCRLCRCTHRCGWLGCRRSTSCCTAQTASPPTVTSRTRSGRTRCVTRAV
jgi:hypothetical protein